MMRLLLILLSIVPMIALAKPPVVLVLGDSLSAGYGLATDQGWVSLLAERIAREGLPHEVINASVSGDTTANGLTRLAPLIERHRPAVLVVELGANDGLRGFGFDVMRENLTRIVREGQDSGSRVLLIGVRLPPNYGASYTQGFQAVFRDVSTATGVPLVPTLLKDVGEHLELMQPDGLHPLARAEGQLLDNVWPTLEPLLLDTAGNRH